MIVFVMYDQEEVLVVLDWIVVMNVGCIEQIGFLEQLYMKLLIVGVVVFVGLLSVVLGVVEGDYVMVWGQWFLLQFFVDGFVDVYLCLENVYFVFEVDVVVDVLVEESIFFGSMCCIFVCMELGEFVCVQYVFGIYLFFGDWVCIVIVFEFVVVYLCG